MKFPIFYRPKQKQQNQKNFRNVYVRNSFSRFTVQLQKLIMVRYSNSSNPIVKIYFKGGVARFSGLSAHLLVIQDVSGLNPAASIFGRKNHAFRRKKLSQIE